MTTFPSTIAGRDPVSRANESDASGQTGWFIGLFALVGLGFAGLQPPLAVTIVLALFLSSMAGGMAFIAAQDDRENALHDGLRLSVRLIAPVLAASLLWLAIGFAGALFGGTSTALASAAAVPLFVVLVLADAVLGAALQFGLARVNGLQPGAAVALLVADKYVGLAGDLR